MVAGRYTELKGGSRTDPLKIDEVRVPGCAGIIGMTFCPGKKDHGPFSEMWDRDLESDLETIRSWGAAAMVSLLDQHEFQLLQVEELPARVMTLGMHWIHLPIENGGLPNGMFEELWLDSAPFLKRLLRDGLRVLLHCNEGLGRTGIVAAKLLVEMGMEPAEVIRTVRKARAGTITTVGQEKYILSLGWVRTTPKGEPKRLFVF